MHVVDSSEVCDMTQDLDVSPTHVQSLHTREAVDTVGSINKSGLSISYQLGSLRTNPTSATQLGSLRILISNMKISFSIHIDHIDHYDPGTKIIRFVCPIPRIMKLLELLLPGLVTGVIRYGFVLKLLRWG